MAKKINSTSRFDTAAVSTAEQQEEDMTSEILSQHAVHDAAALYDDNHMRIYILYISPPGLLRATAI